jgi:hypothetical protein
MISNFSLKKLYIQLKIKYIKHCQTDLPLLMYVNVYNIMFVNICKPLLVDSSTKK